MLDDFSKSHLGGTAVEEGRVGRVVWVVAVGKKAIFGRGVDGCGGGEGRRHWGWFEQPGFVVSVSVREEGVRIND